MQRKSLFSKAAVLLRLDLVSQSALALGCVRLCKLIRLWFRNFDWKDASYKLHVDEIMLCDNCWKHAKVFLKHTKVSFFLFLVKASKGHFFRHVKVIFSFFFLKHPDVIF